MKKNELQSYANTGYGGRFSFIDIGLEDYVGVVNSDTAFWSIVPKAEAGTILGQSRLADAYNSKESAFQLEIETLRSQVQPTAVYFNPTDRCNLNCNYCYLPEDMRRDGKQMSPAELRQALMALKDYFSSTLPEDIRPQLVFHGSEPLLAREAIFEAIEDFGQYFRFGVQTNATLLDKEAIDFLTAHSVGVGISLDAHEAEIANATRRHWNNSGSFDKVLSALKQLAGYPGLNVICTVTKTNVSHLTEIVDFFHAEGILAAMLNPVRCTRKGGQDLKPDNLLLAKEFIKALDRAFELYEKTNQKMVIANFANILAGIIAPTARRLMCDISPCGGGRCFFAVSAEGDVFPCSEFIGLEQFKGGNIFSQNVNDCLNSKPFKQVVSRRIESFEPCGSCAIRHFCGAPCPAEIFSNTGQLDAPSSYCQFYEEQVRYALRIIANGNEHAYLWDNWETTTTETFSLSSTV